MLPLWGASMMGNKGNIFYCTRSSLARLLMEAGAKAEKTVNPYNSEFPAWKFEVDNLVLSVATEFYKGIEKPLPKSLERAAADGKQP